MDIAEVIEVIKTTLTRRGNGTSEKSPIRVITQYWSKEGTLLAEHDPVLDKASLIQMLQDAVGALGGLTELAKVCPELAGELRSELNIPDNIDLARGGAK
jgi:predicted ATPase